MKKILVVVDFQNDFVDGTLGFDHAKDLEEPIVKRIEQALSSNEEVVFTRDTHQENYLETQEGKKLPVVHCVENTHGWEIYGKVKEYVRKCFDKPTFGSLELGLYLQQGQYDVVELVGLVSNICVISNAVIAKAALPEAEIIVNEELTDSYDKDLHAKALDVMEGFQVTVQRK